MKPSKPLELEDQVSDTPRTDAEECLCKWPEHPQDDYVESSFARQLERELTAAKLQVCDHCGGTRFAPSPPGCPRCGAPQCCINCCNMDELERKLAASKAKLKEEVGKAYFEGWTDSCVNGHNGHPETPREGLEASRAKRIAEGLE